ARGTTNLQQQSFHRVVVELVRPFLIEECAFFFVAATPVLVTPWDAKELPRAHALFTVFILVEVSALQHNQPHIIGVSVHSCIISGVEFREGCMCAFGSISPNWCG